ncbi:MAG: hypothetical protein H7273_06765 [Polaromonas sp.]|nr:hypothetical protein [Polaromonas sp.]
MLLFLSLALFCNQLLLALLGFAGRGLPGGNSLFFASPKKSKQKKGDPAAWVPALRYGQPVMSGKSGGPRKLACGSNSARP